MPSPTSNFPFSPPPDISQFGIRVGTSGFEHSDWAGLFYHKAIRPQGNLKVTSKDWFSIYQSYFSFLEIGHTFYQEPQLQQFEELERSSKSSMRFSVKVYRDISHKGVWNSEEGKSLMRKHAVAVSPLSETGRFHSFLIQLDDTVERNRKILDYLLTTASVALSEGLNVHIEFRNRTWHQESVLQALKDAGVGICNTEIPAIGHAYPLKAYATSALGYVRYHGLNLPGWETLKNTSARYDYNYSQLELKERVRSQIKLLQKTGTVAIVFNNHTRAQAALNAIENINLLDGHFNSAKSRKI